MQKSRKKPSREHVASLPDTIAKHKECGSKIRYTMHQAALVAIGMTERKGVPFDAYECIWCARFHVGHARNPVTLG